MAKLPGMSNNGIFSPANLMFPLVLSWPPSGVSSGSSSHRHSLPTGSFVYFMVLALDGSAEIGAHAQSNLFRSRAVTCYSKELFSLKHLQNSLKLPSNMRTIVYIY